MDQELADVADVQDDVISIGGDISISRAISTGSVISIGSSSIKNIFDFAVGAVLGQRVEKRLHAISYASRTLNDAQLNYSTTKKELLAVIFALEKFRSYLIGSKVIVFTDHATLKYLLAKKDANRD